MTTDMLESVLKQGGLLAVVTILIWIIREMSQRHYETAKAYMEFGERYSKGLTEMAQLQLRSVNAIERIEQRLGDVHVCPVSQVHSEQLREAARTGRPVPNLAGAVRNHVLSTAKCEGED